MTEISNLIQDISEKTFNFSEECRKIIFSHFYVFSEELENLANSKVNYALLEKAVKDEDEDTIEKYQSIALLKCYNKIDKALEDLFHPKLKGIVNGSHALAVLSIFTAATLKSQNIPLLREDMKDDAVVDLDSEAYKAIVLSVLETIVFLSKKKLNDFVVETSLN